MAGGQSTGGSLQLVKLIDEHGQAILADLRHYYGRDLHDLWRDGGKLTPRHVLWLVGQLPEGSAFFASVQGGPKYRSWTLQTHLAAATVNMLFAANRQRAGKPTKNLPVKPPKPAARTRRAGARVVRIADLPSTRRVAGR